MIDPAGRRALRLAAGAAGLGLALGLALLALPAAARADGEPACVDVVNHTPYWMPGSARAPGARSVDFRLGGMESNRLCLAGDAVRITAIEVTIKSGWGLPIGSCRLYAGGRMEIDRQQTEDGERTRLNCR